MTKPKTKRKAKPRPPADRDLEAVVGSALAFLAGAAFGKVQPPDAAATCAACGHARGDHCGCGKTCLWHGPPRPGPDGQLQTQLCACAGFTPAPGAGDALCGDGPLGPLLGALGLRGKP